MMPIVDGLEDEFSGQIMVLRLNVVESENAQLMLTYGLRGHPSFAVLDGDGQVARVFFGPQSVEDLHATIIDVLK